MLLFSIISIDDNDDSLTISRAKSMRVLASGARGTDSSDEKRLSHHRASVPKVISRGQAAKGDRVREGEERGRRRRNVRPHRGHLKGQRKRMINSRLFVRTVRYGSCHRKGDVRDVRDEFGERFVIFLKRRRTRRRKQRQQQRWLSKNTTIIRRISRMINSTIRNCCYLAILMREETTHSILSFLRR